jgi:hypothetical protein
VIVIENVIVAVHMIGAANVILIEAVGGRR